jgi:hypothetical protein
MNVPDDLSYLELNIALLPSNLIKLATIRAEPLSTTLA